MKCDMGLTLHSLGWSALALMLTQCILAYEVLINDGKINDGAVAIGQCAGGWGKEKEGTAVYYATCTSTQPQDCYLVTEFYNAQGAIMVLADVTMQVHRCFSVNISGCVESLNFLVYSGSSPLTIDTTSVVQNLFRPLATVPADGLPASREAFVRFSSTVKISDLANKTGFHIAVQTKGYCGQVRELKLYYYKCPTVSESLAEFPEQYAPDEATKMVQVSGACAAHAILDGSNKPVLTCYSDGRAEVQGSCLCDVGYTKVDKSCAACPEGQFKNGVGNQACSKCGANVKPDREPRTSCFCKDGYDRAVNAIGVVTADCYRPPASVSNIRYSNITSNGLSITWDAPALDSFHGPVTYKLLCTNCPQGNQAFPRNTTSTSISIQNTGAFARYQIEIVSSNNVTDLIGKSMSAPGLFQTAPGIPGPIRDFRTESDSDGKVKVSWLPPFAEGGEDLRYKITWGDTESIISTPRFTIPTDTQDRTYVVTITPLTTSGEGETCQRSVSVAGGVPLSITLGVAVAVVVFVVIVLLVLFFVWRRRHPAYTQVVRMEDGTVKFTGGILSPRGKQLYVDPTNYGDVDTAVTDNAQELSRADVRVGKLLGGGEFCDVYQGTLARNGKEKQVAIKTLKQGATKSDRDDFLSEAAILGQFTDPNVVFLEGVILKDRPNMIVLEFMACGALDKFLQTNDMQLTVLQLLGMARGVASGMKYLSELGYIHRDLAARNILVGENRVCKVADFGMSREIKVDETYDTKGGKIPVRWTAPEAIQFKKFTTASDVWSYGVLLWEIMSFGERPYWDWGNYEVLERVNSGYRLPPPMSCPKVVHDLMLHCWNKDRSKRPKFSSLRDKLDGWIRNSELLTETASVVTKHDENLDYTVLQTTNRWLEAIGMGRYARNFVDQGYATPRQILLLTMDDLEALGIGPIGHRKKIFKAIQNTKAQVEAQIDRNGGTAQRAPKPMKL